MKLGELTGFYAVIVFTYKMMVNIMSFEHAFKEKMYPAQQTLHLKKKI